MNNEEGCSDLNQDERDLLDLDDSSGDRGFRQTGNGMDSEFCHETTAIRFHRPFRDVDPGSDFPGPETLANKPQDKHFTLGEIHRRPPFR